MKIYNRFTYTQNHYKKFLLFFIIHKNEQKKYINFDDKNICKSTFYKNKTINDIEDIDINNILVSKKEAYDNKNSLKYFIGNNDNDIIRPLCIKLPQMTVMLENLMIMQQYLLE